MEKVGKTREVINKLQKELGVDSPRGKRLAYYVSEFYKQARTELEEARFLLNIENTLDEEMEYLCPECAGPSLNGGKGPFCCMTCRRYRCDNKDCKDKKKPIVESNGHKVCTSCGVVGDPVFVREVVKRDEDGNRLWVRPTNRKRTSHDRAKSMEDKLLDYKISEENREAILKDFKKILVVLDKRTSKPYSVGNYDYLILRLASRRGIEVGTLTPDEIEYRREQGVDKMVEKSVRSKYRGLPYDKKRTEDMWDEIRSRQEKVKTGEVEAPVVKIKSGPVDTKTPETLRRMDGILYGESGVYETLGWKSVPGDKYHNEYVESGVVDDRPKVGQWRCNVCEKNYAMSNKSKHEKTTKHVRTLEKKGIKWDNDIGNYVRDGEIYDIGYYNNRTMFLGEKSGNLQ